MYFSAFTLMKDIVYLNVNIVTFLLPLILEGEGKGGAVIIV